MVRNSELSPTPPSSTNIEKRNLEGLEEEFGVEDGGCVCPHVCECSTLLRLQMETGSLSLRASGETTKKLVIRRSSVSACGGQTSLLCLWEIT